jgi:Cu/Ag efflux pump CusA
MKRLSTPMFGGLVSLVLLTLFVVLVIYLGYAGRVEIRRVREIAR